MKKHIILITIVIIAIIVLILIKPAKIKLTNKYYSEGKFIENIDITNLKDENYILYVYNPYCSFETPCENIFKSFMEDYKIDFVSVPFNKFKETYLYQNIKYAPTIIIIEKGKAISYLDANSDKDTEKYQNQEAFKNWITKYIEINN